MLFGGDTFALRRTSARAIVVAEVHAFAHGPNRMGRLSMEELLKARAKIANIAFGQFVRINISRDPQNYGRLLPQKTVLRSALNSAEGNSDVREAPSSSDASRARDRRFAFRRWSPMRRTVPTAARIEGRLRAALFCGDRDSSSFSLCGNSHRQIIGARSVRVITDHTKDSA